MEILGYTIVNEEKYNRAIHGTMSRGGVLIGGVGEGATDLEKLAEYDKLAGCIRKGKHKVKLGSFYDFKKRAPRPEPQVVLVFRDLEGNVVEIPEGDAIPVEVRAAEMAQEKARAKKKKAKVEDEE